MNTKKEPKLEYTGTTNYYKFDDFEVTIPVEDDKVSFLKGKDCMDYLCIPKKLIEEVYHKIKGE